MTLQERYLALWQRLGVNDPSLAATGALVIAAYDGPGRYYHSGVHLRDVLDKLDWAKDALEKTGEVKHLAAPEKQLLFDMIEMALWYHDAVYDAKAKDNEEKSRDLFLLHAQGTSLPESVKREVASLIDLTKQHKNAKTRAEKILTDCDLAILGAPAPAFAAYDANIRKEYAHVLRPVYQSARKTVLKGFLDQTEIFKTAAFRNAYEAQAKKNLQQAIKNPLKAWAETLFHK